MVPGAGDVVPAAHVHPFHAGQHVAELLIHRFQGGLQVIRILLTQGVEVDAVQQLHQIRCHGCIPLGSRGAHAAAGRTGVVDGMAFLGGTFRVDPQPHTLARLFGHGPEGGQLPGRIEHDVVRHPAHFFHLVRFVGAAEHVDFLAAHFFPAQFGLVQAAGFRAGHIGLQHRVQVVVGKGLLGQQDLTARPVLHPFQDLAVVAQGRLVQNVAGRGQMSENLLRCFPLQTGKSGTIVPHVLPVHYFTSSGSWDSLLGRPYLSSAARNGSGSSSSTVCTPGFVHLPVSSIRAPHMAGTPVV